MNDILFLSTPKSEYFQNLIYDHLIKKNFQVSKLAIKRSSFPDGEQYYRLDVQSNFQLLGKTAIYVCALINDADILEVVRVGSTLAQYGVRRRIFVIPFLAYSTMERAVMPGEVVTAKCTIQMLSSIGSMGNGNVFLLFDLHTAGLLHYFEGSCIRLEVYGQKCLQKSLPQLGFDPKTYMFASADLGRTAWVNAFARDNGTGVAFIRKVRTHKDGKVSTSVCEIIGNVKGYHLIIYDDMTRTGGTLIHAAEAYLANGALTVDVMVSHLALIGEKEINDLINSPIRKIIATNSHPQTQHPLIKSSDKFIIIDASLEFEIFLEEILPNAKN
ncbi:putative ribose-phosphate pyrophosphokinase [Histomonas meleagridis]|uniref:putative ribose-phosphate pyrophosphokinase n=1 Tax=Histomonas meleagridis TaxID=135588 RepID=UPI0035593A81|nr:putative ribose-phosphate pyrophosphokinase [Histomonas meleagridis]KAH0797484.1 putative ribose-phosphate pyrophosphokinase [Histomonas meleagridis]